MRLTFLVFEFYRHRSASRSRAMVAMSVLMLDCYWLMLSDCFVHHERSRQCVVCHSQKREFHHYRWSLADRAPCSQKTEKIFLIFFIGMSNNFFCCTTFGHSWKLPKFNLFPSEMLSTSAQRGIFLSFNFVVIVISCSLQ